MKNDIRTYADQEMVHFRELSTGERKTGLLRIEENRISLNVVSYDGYFSLSNFNPLILETEKGDVVSLYGKSGGHPAIIFSNNEDSQVTNTVHSCAMTSNIAIVGQTSWPAKQAIKRIEFCMPDLNNFLSRTPAFKRIKTQNMTSRHHKCRLFTLRSREFVVRCECSLLWDSLDTQPTDVKPFWEIEFRNGVSLDGALNAVGYLRAFFSLALGRCVYTTNFEISNYSRAAISRQANRQIYRRNWDLYCPGFERNKAKPRPNRGSDLFHGKSTISDIKICLKDWMDRMIEWKKPAQLMLSSLDRWNEDSAERLLCACRWLEDLPNIKVNKAINESDTDEIAEAAAASAKQLGYNDNIQKRVRGAINLISEESQRQRFERLKSMIERRFGTGIVGQHFVDDLVAGNRMRGLAAHGLFMFDDDQKWLNALRGMHATEVLCMLLTCLELPLPADVAEQIAMSDRIQDYRSLYVSLPGRG